eukprot:CCRYP_000522-RA/>CCRYP_000522-RA protein AED:0.45 eAED:0.45 QI:389/1/1/1/0/0.5/2/147/123
MKKTMPKVSSTKGKEIGTLKCMCFKYHHRTLSTPCILIRKHQALPNSCACNKWGTELTRKSYSHLSCFYQDKEKDATKSMVTFDCGKTEILTGHTTPDRLREWWGFFLDPSEAEADLRENDED